MTKELELLVKKWRDDGIRLNGGADKPYSDDENSVRAFVLEHCAEELAAALAKAQEGLSLADAEKVLRESSGHAWEFMGDSIVVSLDTAIATLTAQQKAPEGDGIVLCRECGKPTMHMGTLCFHCSKSDNAAPDGGDVEQRAQELLANEMGKSTTDDQNRVPLEYALRAITAALSAPKQVEVVPDMPESLRAKANRYGVGGFNLSVSEYTWLCTLAASTPQAAPVPVEGEPLEFFTYPAGLHPKTINLIARFATALAEKLAKAEQKYGYSDGWASPDWMDECRDHLIEHVHKGDPRDVAAYCAFLWHHGESTTPPPSQPAVELEQFRTAVELYVQILRQKLSEKRAFRLDVAAAQRDFEGAERLLALIDGAKAGKGEGHG